MNRRQVSAGMRLWLVVVSVAIALLASLRISVTAPAQALEAAAADVVFAVNAGGAQYVGADGTVYQADARFSGGSAYTTTVAIAGTADDRLYQSERFGNFSYNIPVANGNYLVMLKFAELHWSKVGQRVFNVSLEGKVVLSSLDLVAKVGPYTAYDVTIPVTVTDGSLAINFQSVVDNAMVSGIKVEPFDTMFRDSFAFAGLQLSATTRKLSTASYPHYTAPQGEDGTWVTTGDSAWTSGFFPGALWLMYQQTADPTWRTYAQTWQAGIIKQQDNTSNHDLGFMLFNSFGNGYRLTGTDAYRQVVLTSARSLASRYNMNNAKAGSIKASWPSGSATDYKVIIDIMINLELLFWASRNGGDPAWYDMAMSHALKTAANHVRPDGSTYHVVNYNPSTGEVKSKSTAQGYADESTWARGQAWAIYGFTMTYRYTGDVRFLNTARATADYFIANLPSDSVPPWDFEVPGMPDQPSPEDRDSSAAAVAASGLLELSQLDTDATRRQKYLTAATQILTALSSPTYLADGHANDAILLHGTSFKSRGNYDTGLIYGDYYFLEAMLRYRWIKAIDPILAVAAVTASADDGNRPENTFDNNFSTRWSAQGDGQWILFDLGAIRAVRKIAVAWYLGDKRTARFEVHTSRDGVTWTTGFTGISCGTTTRQETYDLPDEDARYVRIVGHGNSLNTWNSITEVDIYGD
jgi:unsaturated chondroitin disaccharide hydrolase